MRKSFALLLALALLTALCLITLSPVNADSKMIVVPDDYPTIAAAIGNATDGDTIFVKKGTYNTLNESLQINKPIQLIGEDRDTTIIDGNHAGNIVEVTANNVEISGFTIQNSGSRETGIQVKTCKGSRITNNVIKNNFGGLVLDHCSNILISENKIQSNFGTPNIFISNSSYVTFSKNYVANNAGEALVVYHCSDSTVAENQIVTNGFSNGALGLGAVVSNSRGITVSMNNITGNAQGLGLVESHANNIFRNYVRSNSFGIGLSTGTTDNSIYENNIQSNNHGIDVHEASNNRVYHNNFTSNTVQISFWLSTEINIWDNGDVGNYWSDYNGTDANGDGIGDSQYVINANNTDRYPLMTPFNGSNVIPPSSKPQPATTPPPSPSPNPSPSLSPSPTPSTLAIESKQTETFSTAIIAAASGASLAVIGAGLFVHFRKRNHLSEKNSKSIA